MLSPQVPGVHNLWNAALAASLALHLGIPGSAVESGVRAFAGVGRRLERLGRRFGVEWFSDYGHHPTEIRATHQALRDLFPERRLLVVFQPHQACRTAFFCDDFARELAAFDEVILAGIFSVREGREQIERALNDLEKELVLRGTALRSVDGLGDVMQSVEDRARAGDVVVLMGAGDIDDLAEPMRQAYREVSVA
jgi:UDP-N-acetylmuramate--alanine ligase